MSINNKLLLKVNKALKNYSFIELFKIINNKALDKTGCFLIKNFVFLRESNISCKKFNNIKPKMIFFFDDKDKSKIIELLDSEELKNKILGQADDIMNHVFDLLGSGKIKLGNKINWHEDFKTKKVWDKSFYLDLQKEIFDSTQYFIENTDVKVPWELSRFQHISVLGQAYWFTGDEKYSTEFKSEILDWINENPMYLGINWASPMDVSIRAINMIIGYYYFQESEIIDKEFWALYFKQLYISGRFVSKNLECNSKGHGNNHYLSNISGLLWLGLFFGEFDRHTIKWLDIGIKGLISEMDYQVNEDGGTFEGSISYHRLSAEILLSSTILAEKNNFEFPQWYKNRLEKMCEFTMDYTKPNGNAPLFGDSDDGRLHILGNYFDYDKTDHKHLLGVAADYFDRSDFAFFARNNTIDSVWINGKIKNNNKLHIKPKLKVYKETGIYIINHEELYMIIKCGKIGQHGNGGHDHNDQLSFELNINGEDIIVDSGSYVYGADKDLRHLFRSSASHNISQIDDLEQNIIKNQNTQDLFTIHSKNEGICDLFTEEDHQIHFRGNVKIGNSDIKYQRDIIIDLLRKEITISDTFLGELSNKESCKSRLFLSKDVAVKNVREKELVIHINNNELKLVSDNELLLGKAYVSESYGVKKETSVVSFDFKSRSNCLICY